MTEKFSVSDDQYRRIDQKIGGIKRKLNQRGGSPLHPAWIEEQLQRISEGKMHPRFTFLLTLPFNPAEFTGESWKVWLGPIDGDGLQGEPDVDLRGEELREIDWLKVLFETCLKIGEGAIKGEEKLLRLKKNALTIRLGSKAFVSLWEDYRANGRDSVLEWFYQTKGIRYLDFMGLILRNPHGDRCVLCFDRGDGNLWRWSFYHLDKIWEKQHFSACFINSEPRFRL